MTTKNTKTTTVLYISMLLAVAVIIPTSAIATESLYDQLFPDTYVPADIKSQIESNLNTDAIDMPLPANQETIGRTASNLLKQIEDATDPSVKEQLQSELDGMMSEMLKAGVVPRHLYEENPDMWDNLLESFRQQ